MFAKVVARKDVRTASGMKIVKKGQCGKALGDLQPNQVKNIGKVAVQWRGKKRIYWTPTEYLRFVKRVDVTRFVSHVPAEEPKVQLPTYTASEFDFGRSLRMFRKARGMGQVELSERIGKKGVCQTTISFWERRAACPPGRLVQAAAKALQIPPFFFFIGSTGEGTPNKYFKGMCSRLEEGRNFMRRLKGAICPE